MATCLITGGGGNLATQLTRVLSERFKRIVLLDIVAAPVGKVAANADFERVDLTDANILDRVFRRVQPDTIIHLASLLSGSCEVDRLRGWQVNLNGTFHLFETALRYKCPTILFASSIAAFGGSLPETLNDHTPQWPDGLYGVTKVAAERLGVYYQKRHGLDFRCLRLPTTVSRHAPPGAVSALASQAYIKATRSGKFTFHSRPDTKLALIYINDVLRAFSLLLSAQATCLSQCVYNIGAMTVTPRQIADALQRRLPNATLLFEPEEPVASLLASWPGVIDDNAARRDWGWQHEYDLERTTDAFLAQLRQEFKQASP